MKPKLLTFPILLSLASSLNAQQPKPQILVLGTYHMAGSGDYIQTTTDDVLSPKRQREVQELVDRLAAFRPTKILVEESRDSSLNAGYQRYLAGRDTLTRNETDQIGFRLAKQLGHKRLYAIDYKLNEDMGSVMGFAGQNGDTAFISLVQRFGARLQAQAQSRSAMTITEYLRLINSEEEDLIGQRAYMRMARVGKDSSYVGADVVAKRYERNLKIFANLARVTEPGDRVLVIYGAGHGYLLRDFIRNSDDFLLVQAGNFLAPPLSPHARGRPRAPRRGLAIDANMRLAYLLEGSEVHVYNLNTFVLPGTVPIPEPNLPFTRTTHMIRRGIDGLAFLDQTKLFLVRSPNIGQ